MCLPCADAVPICQRINTWRRNSTTGIVPNDLNNPFNGNSQVQWKIVAMGVGNALSDVLGARELRGMNYNPDRTMNVPWSDLTTTLSEVVDQSCNQVTIEVN